MAQALLVPAAMAFLVALLMLGSWLEVRLARAEQQLKLVPVKAGSDAKRTPSGNVRTA
ncbi:MAG TPA: hypothetical protein VGV63_02995 [Acidimicrobiales bacterium]|nr:hypothetical protein [Acidimicrobiales bacterium]